MYGPMLENWGQMWQWMGQMQLILVLSPLILAAVVAFVLMTRDERTTKPIGPPS